MPHTPLEITVLGCGNSIGVPALGCKCATCTSTDPKNTRTRASIFVQSETTSVLIDAGPDMRHQLMANGLANADAVIFTHAHADHINGADDIRNFNRLNHDWITVYGNAPCLKEISERFDYMFYAPRVEGVWYKPCLLAQKIDHMQPLTIGDIDFLPIEVMHGKMKVLGFRMGDFAYITDCHHIEDGSLDALKGVKNLIIDCVTYHIDFPNPTHSDLHNTMKWLDVIQPEQAYFTHMSHKFEYNTLKSELPKHIQPAFDGLKLKANAP